MMMDRLSPWRKARLDKLAEAFPQAHFYGNGWGRRYLPPDKELDYLRRAKIGPNLHNSTGPINFRTFYLPANGVMQICDNKSHLGKVYELDKEVIGFSTVEECIDLCRYFLAHDAERRQIAAEGWRRAVTDYNEVAVFSRTVRIIMERVPNRSRKDLAKHVTIKQRQKTKYRSAIHTIRTTIVSFLAKDLLLRVFRQIQIVRLLWKH